MKVRINKAVLLIVLILRYTSQLCTPGVPEYVPR